MKNERTKPTNTPKTPAHSLNKVYRQNKETVVLSTHIHTLTFTYNAELLTLLSQKTIP